MRFSIHIKDTLKKCGIPPEQLEVLASDRDTWRTMCNQGLTIFCSNYTADAEKNMLVDTQCLLLLSVPFVTSVAESVHQTSGFIATSEATPD